MGALGRSLKTSAVVGSALALTALAAGLAHAEQPEPPPYLGEYLASPPGLPAPPPIPGEGSVAGAEPHPGPPRIEKATVVDSDRPAGQTVRIYVRGGYCVGEPPPSIDRVSIREHRLPESRKIAAVITAFLKRPAPLEFTDAEPAAGEGPPQPVQICAGVEHALFKRVLLGHPPDELVLFDGSQSPPSRIPAAPGNALALRQWVSLNLPLTGRPSPV